MKHLNQLTVDRFKIILRSFLNDDTNQQSLLQAESSEPLIEIFDSVALVEIQIGIEDRWNKSIPCKLFRELRSLDDLLETVRSFAR